MNVENFILGGILFVLGLVTIGSEITATVFLMGLGIVFMAAGLGTDACKKVFEIFLSIFKTIIEGIVGILT